MEVVIPTPDTISAKNKAFHQYRIAEKDKNGIGINNLQPTGYHIYAENKCS